MIREEGEISVTWVGHSPHINQLMGCHQRSKLEGSWYRAGRVVSTVSGVKGRVKVSAEHMATIRRVAKCMPSQISIEPPPVLRPRWGVDVMQAQMMGPDGEVNALVPPLQAGRPFSLSWCKERDRGNHW